MIKLFFDIETIPCDEKTRVVFEEIQRFRAEKKGTLEELTQEKLNQLYTNTNFDGTFGRICCIAYIKEDGTVSKGVLYGDEKNILEQFWHISRGVNLFVGHNIMDFDFSFIYKRSIIYGVKPRNDILFARYRNFPIFDTMWEWNKWGRDNVVGLDTLAKVFGYPTSKDEMNGSEVWKYYQEGKIEEICRYCMKDVELVRQVYYRMIFEQVPQ